jgi:Mrp family chromosome partitioning ATPase
MWPRAASGRHVAACMATGPGQPASESTAPRPLEQLASSERSSAAAPTAASGAAPPGVAGVRHLLAVASCKGGVGKSTTAVNLAFALAATGAAVGIVDLDIHGPSLPTMVAPDGPLQVEGETLLPLTCRGVKLMSMGFINAGAMPLRGAKVPPCSSSWLTPTLALTLSLAKVSPLVKQLVGRTAWGELDYLVIDMPPGTADVQLTLAQDFAPNNPNLTMTLTPTLTLRLTLALTPSLTVCRRTLR